MSVTLQQVAGKCGIHRNTVSKILSGTYKGDENTIARVQEVAVALGYSSEASVSNASPKGAVKDSELPEGARLYEPETKLTRDHKWSLDYVIKVACEWEYDEDTEGYPIEDSRKVVATEDRHFSLCFPERPTLRQIEAGIQQQKSMIPEAI